MSLKDKLDKLKKLKFNTENITNIKNTIIGNPYTLITLIKPDPFFGIISSAAF